MVYLFYFELVKDMLIINKVVCCRFSPLTNIIVSRTEVTDKVKMNNIKLSNLSKYIRDRRVYEKFYNVRYYERFYNV